MTGRLIIVSSLRLGLLTATIGVTCAATHAQVTSTAFQNGLNGYNNTFVRRISSQPDQDLNGIDVASFYVDGFAAETETSAGSDDQQGLIRFDNIIGSGAGQIPSGATVLDARLRLVTSLAGNADSPGPFGVSGLLQPIDETTSYFSSFSSTTDFTSRGAWWQDGSATRPTGGYGVNGEGDVDRAVITPIVQAWADGGIANNGLVVQAGMPDSITEDTAAHTTNGWSFRSTGYPFSDSRPMLEVSYTTAPVEANTFQRGSGGYSSDTMAIIRSGSNALNADVDSGELTEDASLLDQTFLDGVFFSDIDGNTSSPDHFALLKFDDVFGDAAGQAPSDVPVAKAWAVITTGDTSASAQTSGPWSAYTMLQEWDTSTLHSSLGDVNGLQVGDGDISEALDTLDGFIRGSEVWFDVTDYLEGVRNGAADNGIAVIADGTADGWQIHTNGSATANARPRLVVYSADLGVIAPGLAGDFNDDGVVDAGDFAVWRDNLGTENPLNGAGDETGGSAGVVDAADYALWRSNYGQSGGGGPVLAGAVPAPGAVALAALGCLAIAVRRRR